MDIPKIHDFVEFYMISNRNELSKTFRNELDNIQHQSLENFVNWFDTKTGKNYPRDQLHEFDIIDIENYRGTGYYYIYLNESNNELYVTETCGVRSLHAHRELPLWGNSLGVENMDTYYRKKL